ncbi:MAG: right-handed parallel beta-helix repeat-containing protein [Anaerostipes hadrus]|nr:right-handed parallel beta-helix repeat-containing protein [Anaerostipes hadrus]
MAKINDLPLLPNPTGDMYCLVGKGDLQKVPWSAIMGQIGAPYIATTAAGMTDKTRVYVYQGSESGYTSGNWYYWNGSAWTSGGTYNSAAVDTDKTLTQSDKPADSAIVGKEIGSLKESLKNATVTDGSITTSKIADKAVTGDKIDFIDKKEFHFYTPTGDANAENASANKRNYMIPFEVGTPYIYMIMQTMHTGRKYGSVNAPYKSGINNWSQYGYDVSQSVGTVKDKTVRLWFYPEKANSSNYPWTECRKFDCTELNQYFEKSQLSGTQTIYCEVGKAECGWFGMDNDTWTNKEKVSILWLKEEPTLNDWLNGFETVETLNKNVEANFLKMRYALGMYHNVLDYGITQDADDNSLKFQQMVDELSQNGGGTIYVPIGTYKFDTSNGQYIEGTGGCKCCIKAKSNVSIVGESLTDSVFKMTGHSSQGVCMFGYNSAANKKPIEGCTYRNFTVNGEECTIDTYSSDGKAFFYQYVKNCVWRDLRLIGTPATSLGIDFLDNVVIDSIYCYESGRIHADNSPGGAGVGIGTGAWENENFIVRNCICDNCGHFGIFLEDQHIFGDASHRTPTYPKGVIIANNICRNGRNYGFGVRGGQHVIFDGNEAYENANGGFFSDYQNKSIVIQNNLIRDNTGNGICLGNEKPGILETSFENVTIKDNVVIGNKTGINISQKTTNLNLIDNIVMDNTVKDITVSATQTSCYISGNLVLTADVSNYLNKVENSEL